MRQFALILILACLTLTGCQAMLASQDLRPSAEDIAYIRAHDLEPYIERAIERGDIVVGMSKRDVEHVWGEPDNVDEEAGEVTWRYFDEGPDNRVVFEGGEVVRHSGR